MADERLVSVKKVSRKSPKFTEAIKNERETSGEESFLGEDVLRALGGVSLFDFDSDWQQIITSGLQRVRQQLQNKRELLLEQRSELLRADEVDDTMLIAMLVRHGDAFLLNQKYFELIEPQIRRRFLEQLQGTALVPEEVKSAAPSRLNGVTAQLIDALQLSMDDGTGVFNLFTDKFFISDAYSPEETEHTYVHEAFHALAGTTVVGVTLYNEQTGSRHDNFQIQRSGLRFHNFDERYFIVANRWLDEAITERLAMSLRHQDESPVYKDERDLLGLLQKQGAGYIPQELFVNAYFEEYDLKKPTGTGVPAWKKLSRAINQAYAPGFLTRLDAYVESNGAEAASMQVQNDWREIMNMETMAQRTRRLVKQEKGLD